MSASIRVVGLGVSLAERSTSLAALRLVWAFAATALSLHALDHSFGH